MIACHRLSDANHTYPQNIFLNYYSFVKESIKFLKNTNHQIFIKIHPSSTTGEASLIKKLVNKQKIKKASIIPKNINTVNVIKQVDVLITLHGTIAIENAIIKKNKAIICADSAFSNLGFSKRIKSLFEYKKILNNKNLISKTLNDKDIEIAKRYLFFCDSYDMKRKFHLSYSEKYKKNYSSKYIPNDRSLTNKRYFYKLKKLKFFSNFQKDVYFKEVEYRMNLIIKNNNCKFTNDLCL